MTTDDIVDRIDALVDDQLAKGDQGELDVGTVWCPKCRGEWHALPITEHLRVMAIGGVVDPGYRYRDDTSPVWCSGVPIAEATTDRPRCGCLACALSMMLDDIRIPMMTARRSGIRFAQVVSSLDLTSDFDALYTLPDAPWVISRGETTEAEPAATAEAPQDRALPRPATTPPMWADVPQSQRRRRRHGG